jgi:hypothetical protein
MQETIVNSNLPNVLFAKKKDIYHASVLITLWGYIQMEELAGNLFK